MLFRSGDDIIIGFNKVDYLQATDQYGIHYANAYDHSNKDYSIARLEDDQGDYLLVQHRQLGEDQESIHGTDVIRGAQELNIGGRTYSLEVGHPEYLFSSTEYQSDGIQGQWIDVDGNIAFQDGSAPDAGRQGNQAGDDIIIGFNKVD